MRSDNGGEYFSNNLKTYAIEHGIVFERTLPDTPERNGVAERMNRTLNESCDSMLFQAGMSRAWWGEAILFAAHVCNCLPSCALDVDKLRMNF